MRRKPPETWIPATQHDLDQFQGKIVGILTRKTGSVPPKVLRDEIVPDAFAESYAEYLEAMADPDTAIRDGEAFLVTICVRRSLNTIRNTKTREKRIEIRPETVDSRTIDGPPAATLETAMAKTPHLTARNAPTVQLIQKDQMTDVLAAMAELPVRQRAAFQRVVINGQTQVEAAAEIGIGIRPFEKRLRKATGQVGWAVIRKNSDAMCDTLKEMIGAIADLKSPGRNSQIRVVKHVRDCETCRHAVYDSPLAIDLGILLSTGAFTTGSGPSMSERVMSSSIIETPVAFAQSVWERIQPGAHGGEAAAGSAGTGGAILAVGGSKTVVALCAGAATTMCVAAAGVGVIPIPKPAHEKPRPAPTVQAAAPVTVNPPVTLPAGTLPEPTSTPQARQPEPQKSPAREQRRSDRDPGNRSGSNGENEPQQVSYTSPATAAPVTQPQTNQTAAASSLGIPAGSSGGTSASSGGGSSGGSGSSGSSSSGQAKTNAAAAGKSFGFGG